MISLSLDPSINNVGWSSLNLSAQRRQDAWKWGTFKLEGNNLEMRIMDLVQLIIEHVGPIDFLVTEKPTFFSSETGQIAAHMNYTIDLAAIIYFVAGWFQIDHRHHFAITPTQWKGSVPKDVTNRRFLKLFHKEIAKHNKVGSHGLTEHAIDATMMHRFWLISRAVHLHPTLLDSNPQELIKLA